MDEKRSFQRRIIGVIVQEGVQHTLDSLQRLRMMFWYNAVVHSGVAPVYSQLASHMFVEGKQREDLEITANTAIRRVPDNFFQVPEIPLARDNTLALALGSKMFCESFIRRAASEPSHVFLNWGLMVEREMHANPSSDVFWYDNHFARRANHTTLVQMQERTFP